MAGDRIQRLVLAAEAIGAARIDDWDVGVAQVGAHVCSIDRKIGKRAATALRMRGTTGEPAAPALR